MSQRRSAAHLLIVLMVLLAIVSDACGEDQRNAATWYGKAFGRLDSITDAQWELIHEYNANPSATPTPALREALAKLTPVLNDFRRGAGSPYCDWNLDYSQGYELLLPHIQPMRDLARIAAADARVHLQDGDGHGAADRLASLYNLSGQMGDDRTVIGPLVGMHTSGLVNGVEQVGLDHGQFSASDADLILQSLKSLDPTDPFNVLEGMYGEQEFGKLWLADMMGTQDQREHIMEDAAWLGLSEDSAAALGELTDEEFTTQLGQYDQMMDTVVEAFLMEDTDAGRALLEQVYEGVEAGEYGELAQAIAPHFMNVFDRKVETAEELARRIVTLERIASGEIDPEHEINAALFYLRGIALLRELDATAFQRVCDFEAGRIAAVDEELEQTLTDAGDAIAQFSAGSLKRRCDFSFLETSRDPRFFADYVAGMRDAFRVLHADAIRQFRAGDAGAAVDRLSICYCMVGHLGQDDLILSARTAHRGFERTGELTKEGVASEKITGEHRAALHAAVNRIPMNDPFGYLASFADARHRIAREMRRRAEGNGVVREDQRDLVDKINHLDGDRLLYYLAVRDTMIRAARRKAAAEAAPPPDLLPRLDDVIELEMLAAVRREVPQIAPDLATGHLAWLTEGDGPRFGRVVEHVRRARADLRTTLTLLRPAQDEVEPVEAP